MKMILKDQRPVAAATISWTLRFRAVHLLFDRRRPTIIHRVYNSNNNHNNNNKTWMNQPQVTAVTAKEAVWATPRPLI
jgi:hypothetical protein